MNNKNYYKALKYYKHISYLYPGQYIDKKKWIDAQLKHNKERYDAQDKIDQWIKETNFDHKKNVYDKIVEYYNNIYDPVIIIDQYVIKGLCTGDVYTRNAIETLDILEKVRRDLDPIKPVKRYKKIQSV